MDVLTFNRVLGGKDNRASLRRCLQKPTSVMNAFQRDQRETSISGRRLSSLSNHQTALDDHRPAWRGEILAASRSLRRRMVASATGTSGYDDRVLEASQAPSDPFSRLS